MRTHCFQDHFTRSLRRQKLGTRRAQQKTSIMTISHIQLQAQNYLRPDFVINDPSQPLFQIRVQMLDVVTSLLRPSSLVGFLNDFPNLLQQDMLLRSAQIVDEDINQQHEAFAHFSILIVMNVRTHL